MKKYRHEMKYIVNKKRLYELNNKMKQSIDIDTHSGLNGCYCVHSLYFDDYKNSLSFDNDIGTSKRHKWRIRYYNEDNDILFLEKKIKINGLCYKKRCNISNEIYKKILYNNHLYETVFNTQNILLKQFICEILTKHLQPKVIIDYERNAYVEEITNTRVTFDMNIRVSLEIEKYLCKNYVSAPIINSNYSVLEVKYDDILPSYIRNIIYDQPISICSFSKYNKGLKKARQLFL